jgi:hypothetical protein
MTWYKWLRVLSLHLKEYYLKVTAHNQLKASPNMPVPSKSHHRSHFNTMQHHHQDSNIETPKYSKSTQVLAQKSRSQ